MMMFLPRDPHRRTRMGMTCRRVLALVGLVVGVSALAVSAAPAFSDQNVAAGNLNPTDRVIVQEIKVTGDSGDPVSITSVTVKNQGSAASGQIDRIEFWDGGIKLGETTNISGLGSGITVNLGGYVIPRNEIRYLKVFVVVGTSVSGGETVQFQEQFYYERVGSSFTSPRITDLTGETIRKGGFDQTSDSSATTGYLNPGDESEVQTSVFTDTDANGNNILWVQTGSNTILKVENLGSATTSDILDVKVTLTVNGTPYVCGWRPWTPTGNVMDFQHAWFAGLPATIPDDSGVTAKVEMRMQNAGALTDRRTIRTKTTLLVKEGTAGSEQTYEQSMTATTAQTLRKQGFEVTTDQSTAVASGTKATGESLEQVTKVQDSDINTFGVTITDVWVQNLGTADGTEIHEIRVVIGGTTVTVPGAALSALKSGITIPIVPNVVVLDDQNVLVKVYYEIGTPVDGHTLRPVVKARGTENGTQYWSDESLYPNSVELFRPGFEVVENVTPPEGGTAYSGQRLLAQTIHVVDRDENAFGVTIHPVVVKNIGTATSTDIVKIEVWRQDTPGGTQVKLGETTDLSGLRTGGSRIEILHDNVVIDRSPYSETYLNIYVTISEPEVVTAARTVQLETRVLHTENQVGYDKMVTSNPWTLEINHRPVASFTFAAATTPASVQAKADFTYEQTIQFTGTATDADGDAIATWAWTFGDGATSALQNPTHRYPNGGTFTVTLTVTDARGVSGSVSKTITVQGPPNVVPTATFTWTPQAPGETQTVTFTSTVTDSDQPSGTAFTYAWNFGDTATSVVAHPQHAFAAKQTYTVKLTVTDAQSASVTVEHTISVGNTAPVVVGALTASDATPNTGDPVTFTVGTVTDADTGDTIADFKWTFGDSTTLTTDGAFTGGTATHVFNAPGPYTVSVIAVDSRGGESVAKTVTVTVSGPTRVILYAYPNPASTQATFNVLLPDGATDPILRVYTLDGRPVIEVQIAAGQTTYLWYLLDAAGDRVGNGLYFGVVTATAAGGGSVRSEVFRLLIVR
jgi:PKD repeat protein